MRVTLSTISTGNLHNIEQVRHNFDRFHSVLLHFAYKNKEKRQRIILLLPASSTAQIPTIFVDSQNNRQHASTHLEKPDFLCFVCGLIFLALTLH